MMLAIGAVWQVSVIVFATVLLTLFTRMGGWDSSDVLLILATRMPAHGLFVLFLGRVHGLGPTSRRESSTRTWSARCRSTATSSSPSSPRTRSAA